MNICQSKFGKGRENMLPYQYYKSAGCIDFTGTISLKMKTSIRRKFRETHTYVFLVTQ